MNDTVIVHAGEICLKGGNRPAFAAALKKDLLAKLAAAGRFSVSVHGGTFVCRHDPGPWPARLGSRQAGAGSALTDEQEKEVANAIKMTFGVAHGMIARRCEPELGAIKEAARGQVLNYHSQDKNNAWKKVIIQDLTPLTFKVETKRSDKRFPLTSMEVSAELGGTILKAAPGLKVDVRHPDVTVNVLIDANDAYVGVGRIEGPGGLPSGVSGKLVVMLSGGIDSPVAAWKMMRRGCTVIAVHFHSYPYVGAASIEKVKRLAAILGRAQTDLRLHLVPFGDLQREIVAKCDPAMRVVLYRRFMLRIAERIAGREGAPAVVTGDSVGQVASQTLENIRTVSAVSDLPILRPLSGDTKDDIVTWARKIGTYETSIEPHDDCCSVFVPDHPVTRATPARAEREEAKLDVAALVEQALKKIETTMGDHSITRPLEHSTTP